MICHLRENRVFRTYTGGSRIDRLVSGRETADGHFPEDWLASTVRAFNPGREDIVEGLGATDQGVPVSELASLPILVKLLDAAQRLVIQAHPTRAFAREAWNSPVGKTESWFVLEADGDACVHIGFREGVSREKWVGLCRRQDVQGMLDMLHRFPVKKGDCVFVPGGVPHAIGGGCLLLETQEPSDLMVVPEFVTPSGVRLDERKIHGGIGFERMFDCFCYDGYSREEARRRFFRLPVELEGGFRRYIDGAENGIFSVMSCETRGTARRVFEEAFAIVVVTGGQGELRLAGERSAVSRGDRLLILDLRGKEMIFESQAGPLRAALALPAVE